MKTLVWIIKTDLSRAMVVRDTFSFRRRRGMTRWEARQFRLSSGNT